MEAEQRTAELLSIKDRLLKTSEDKAMIEKRLVDIESQRDALEMERRNLQEALQTLRKRQEDQDKAATLVEAQVRTERKQLEEANRRYRDAGEQITVLTQRLAQEEAARQVAEHALQQATGQLEQANSRYQRITGREIAELRDKVEQQNIQLVKIRRTISFRLGYLLIHNFKSVNGLLRLSSALWALRREVIQRRKNQIFVPSSPKLSSVSRPSSIISGPNALTNPLSQGLPLLLTNQYPSCADLYRNGFVHTRVTAYAKRGVQVDVFRLRHDEAVSYHEFEDVNVTSGSQQVLNQMLSSGRYTSVLVHFLNDAMWQVLRHHIGRVNVFVWVHGFEIQPWYRRDNFEDEQQRDTAKIKSEARMTFWRGLLRQMPDNLTLVFVSKYLAEVTMEDLGFRLPESRYAVIHNAIDTDRFAYYKKPPEQRKKILSIRPYASRTYANDLSVKAILALSEKPYFKDLEFRMVGDGKLFDEVLAPVRGFDNVYIERRFLTHAEIAAMHREYGVFLCPSRMDTQGVSRDEAMASGLVPVTNAVAAIPEFVDGACGCLAPPEDSAGLAEGIARLYESPELFLAMSAAAAERVRLESGRASTIELELNLFTNNHI
jgi:glycosyltransferase involved in cell wall biosynthesis